MRGPSRLIAAHGARQIRAKGAASEEELRLLCSTVAELWALVETRGVLLAEAHEVIRGLRQELADR